MMKKYLLLLSVIMIVAVLAACGQSATETSVTEGQKTEAEKTETYEPVTLENAGRTITYTEPPQRAVASYQEYAELAVELGIEDRIVGYGFSRDNTTPDFAEKLKNIPALAKLNPSKEVFLGANPDLFIAWESDLAGIGFGSLSELEELGIKTYVLAGGEKPQTMENMAYKEISEISRIFSVQEKGDELIQSIKNRIDDVQEKIKDEKPLKVFYMRGGEVGSAKTAGGDTLQSHVISLAGGENIFSELTGTVVEVSWEEVIDRDPDVIVFSYCCGNTPESLMETISKNPSLQDMKAVQNEHYVAVGLEEVYATIWIPGGVEKLAKGFYPERFE
ncbi:ABC transporter substrate-binding protein [Bacillus sp. B15-48]|uniref:ABC transporter substrate-binding protein n=1 Tax=Bacillus sp. B15-48 TaxID=1548601 RepID=UPI00193EE819|nr:ABC transporter substrate-binding protein [Bacillus sp. B15-48]MBM4763594.1 ABC transporter substrate-binding protein [Bacillus sp. B15-48]